MPIYGGVGYSSKTFIVLDLKIPVNSNHASCVCKFHHELLDVSLIAVLAQHTSVVQVVVTPVIHDMGSIDAHKPYWNLPTYQKRENTNNILPKARTMLCTCK
jgi:hypothetical protein